ncbi:HAD family hydrolase [Marinoscillum pacificum]|uniref:HAD family hydrolase n=1 Tax=Marinoscillum pacificum TaxID=392723 RepID=UPI002157273C|nr:HAD family hydrolase [Marinoscillum pacificum]
MIKALILDLDDTIYPTKSLGAENFEGFFDLLSRYNDSVSEDDLNRAKHMMWVKPIHVVAEEFGFSERMYEKSMEFFHQPDFRFEIQPFEDFLEIINLELPMYLVTTGPVQLQEPKIDSLKIRHLFVQIIIDDPMHSSGGKIEAFREILQNHLLDPSEVLVIGDNPESEIKAAKELGITTALINRSGNYPEAFSDFGELIKTHF